MSLLSLVVVLWLAVTAALAWLLPRRAQALGIAASTAVFLGFFSWQSLLILTLTSGAVFSLMKRRHVPGAAIALAIGVISAVFIWFKIKSGAGGTVVERSVIPLGLSYYSFRQIHYIFESWKRNLEAHTFSEYLCYLFFLPTLHVGPIHRFPEFLRDLRRRRWDSGDTSAGLERILYGYAKIVIIGNVLIGRHFELFIGDYAAHPWLYPYLQSVSYWLNLYFQFSGYSDVAIGFALVMGFHVMENFNYPFLARNIAEFWQRWHISLTSWCREYVFLPLASVTRLAGPSVLAAMLILGLWHEFSGRYVIWGFYQAAGVVAWHLFQEFKKKLPMWNNRLWQGSLRLASVLLTINYVIGSTIVSNYLYAQVKAML